MQIAGPAVIIYWLGGDNPAAKVRANLLVYFLLTDVMLCVVLFCAGSVHRRIGGARAPAWRSLLRRDGSRRLFFHGASDRIYRRGRLC